MRPKIVFVSGYHDYRTKKKASIQQLADAYVRSSCDVAFVSTRYSWMSKLKGDSRLFLWDRSNRIEVVNGVSCLLWRTAVHPFHSQSGFANRVMEAFYPFYERLRNGNFEKLVTGADYVIIEASAAVLLIERIRQLAPTARIIYYATDLLETVGGHPYLQAKLEQNAGLIDHACLRSRAMVSSFSWMADRLYRAEFGVNRAELDTDAPSPYDTPLNAVSVGSMLFDPWVVETAAEQFPDVHFHVIGAGKPLRERTNLHVHAEMNYRDTVPYVRHANVGIAPYLKAPGSEYLADSSLKLAQYEYYGLPALCPDFAAGDVPSRTGYRPGDPESLRAAMNRSLSLVGEVEPRTFLSWNEVAERVLHPEKYPDIQLHPNG